MKRIFDVVSIVLALGLIVFSIWAWPQLPDRIPTHYGISGRPDAWSDRSVFTWFLLPVLAIGMALLMVWVQRFTRKHPGLVNLPSSTRLVDLPEPAREPILEALAGFLALVQTEILAIFTLIQIATFISAIGGESRGIMIAVLVLAVAIAPILLLMFFLHLMPAMERAKEIARAVGR